MSIYSKNRNYRTEFKTKFDADDKLKRKKRNYTKKEEYKSPIEKRVRAYTRQYLGIIRSHIPHILNSNQMNKSDRNQMVNSINEITALLNHIIRNYKVDEAFYDCIKKRFKEINLFLRRLAQEEYSIGRYIAKYDFHDFFTDEEKVHGSTKVWDAVISFKDFIMTCAK